MNQQTYFKVPFVWEEPKPLIEVSGRLAFKPVRTIEDIEPTALQTSWYAPSHYRHSLSIIMDMNL
ncbi:hypothetical protein [Nostoc sp. ChiQUE01b]|uniref:hypothetical protein n=1 Tax=Nostoc sp. ChiQUE01b TaxID=3075376 RepID=UPI002AD4B69E|nr:hypothetical protein [Nostoc sp. ChiQUE01b]MDZ8263381.1 hypothetical protein [Nostoc sp. ChiQUE01b]